MMENILVTGSTGFIGKHLITYLGEQHGHIRCLVRDSNKSRSVPREGAGSSISLPPSVTTLIADITKPETLRNSCNDIDTVFHLAGFAHATGEHTNEHHHVNYLGTQYILEEAIRAGVKRFIYFSSVKTLDKNDQTPYAIAKRRAEQYVLQQSQQNNIHACVLRPALVYGPGLKGNLASMIKAIDRHLFLPLPETGNRRSLVSVNDLCRAAILVSVNPRANGRVYTVTDNIDYSTRQIYALMCKALGLNIPHWYVPFFVFKAAAFAGDCVSKVIKKRLPLSSETITKLFGSAYYSSQDIQTELGFTPKDSFEKALPEIIAEYRHKCLQKVW